ncbi:response regulator [Verrucomicrobiota bacterium sgz303538]
METSSQSPSLRILVVDDEAAVREVLSACLVSGGHEVGTATDGDEGWHQFQNGEWDLVLTDRIMPGMTGEELAAAIRQVAPHMPVVMVTGQSDDSLKAGGSPIDVILRKPFTLVSLRNAINEARALHRASQRAA